MFITLTVSFWPQLIPLINSEEETVSVGQGERLHAIPNLLRIWNKVILSVKFVKLPARRRGPASQAI